MSNYPPADHDYIALAMLKVVLLLIAIALFMGGCHKLGEIYP